MTTPMVNYVFPVPPMPKPRMVRSDKWKKRLVVERYYAWCNHLKLLARQNKFTLGSCIVISYKMQMPESWSKKKKKEMLGKPHQQTPDLDNLNKATLDALAPAGDQYIYEIHSNKIWAEQGAIEIMNLGVLP